MAIDLRVLPGQKPTSWECPCPICGEPLLLDEEGAYYGCTGTKCTREAIEAKAQALRDSSRVAPVWLEDFLLESIPPPRWLLAPYLQAETVAVLFSAPNVGKTLWAFYAMCQIAMQGKGLVLEAEGSRGAFQRRLGRAAASVGGVPSRRLAALHTNVMSLLDPRHESVIASWAKGYDLTMLDSLAMFTAGVDENDPVGMSHVGASLKRVRAMSGGSVLALAHSVKTSWKPGETPSLANLRGHSALAAMVDTALALVPVVDAPEGTVGFDLHVVKQRDEERVKPRRYTVEMRGGEATVSTEELAAGDVKPYDTNIALDILRHIREAGENGVSKNYLESKVKGGTPKIRCALLALKQAGEVSEMPFGAHPRWVTSPNLAQPRPGDLRTSPSPTPVLRTGLGGRTPGARPERDRSGEPGEPEEGA